MGLKLMAELGLDGAGFHSGLKRAEGAAHGMLEGLKGFVVGAVGIATVEQAISKTVETAKELVETSERLAIAPEQLQVLRQAAKESGVEISALAGAFEKIDIAREKALLPGDEQGKKSLRAFGGLGIDSGSLHSMTAAQLFMGPMRQAVQNRNPEELGVLFRELGIKGFGPLIAVLKKDFDELGDKMRKTGAIMDTETALKLKLLSEEFSMISQIIASQLGPALVKLAEWIYSTVLKAGGKLAGGAAAVGAGTSGWGIKDWAKALTTPGQIMGIGQALFRSGKFKENFADALGNSFGFNWQSANKAAGEAQKPWEDKSKQFQEALARMAEEAEKLKHPKPPDFSASSLSEKMSKKALQPASDSLTKVGNFLGGMGITDRIQERKVKLLESIERNTAAMSKMTHPVSGGLMGSLMDIAFPHF